MKKAKSLIVVIVLILGLFGNVISVSAAQNYNTVLLSTSWKTIASSSTGFNCKVAVSSMTTGTINNIQAVNPDIRMLGRNGNVVWSENSSTPGLSTRVYNCGSDVYTIQIRVSNGSGTARAYRY